MKQKAVFTANYIFVGILSGLIFFTASLAQDGSHQIDMPSPTAASIARVAETPVNLFTGTPSVNIPLEELSQNDITIPVSLSYNPQAIRVQEIGDWVGFGWSLNAGGAVTRVMRGNPDEWPNGYMNTGDIYELTHFNELTSSEQYTFLTEDLKSGVDPEPDVFYYSFPGYSGKFLIAPGGEVYTIPQNNLKIEVGSVTGGNIQEFFIYTPNGTEYTFSRKELLKQTGESITQADYYNAWYLTSVKSITGDAQITLEYNSTTILVTHLSPLYEAKFQNLGSINTPPDVAETGLSRYERVYLKEIRTSDKKIIFHRSLRDDALHYDTGLNDRRQEYRLDSLAVEGRSTGIREKSVKFSYSYPGDRLFLDEVQIHGVNGSTLPHYSFTYKNPGSLPDRLSFKVDHWGYFNDKDNDTFIPSTVFRHPTYTNNYFNGADRSLNPAVADYGVLTKVKYPSGGFTEFEYEPHEYSKVLYPQNAGLTNWQTQNVSFSSSTLDPEIFPFTIDADTPGDSYVNLQASFTLIDIQGVYVKLYSEGNSTPLRTYNPESTSDTINDEFFLSDGSYYIETNRSDNDDLLFGTLSVDEEKIVDKKTGGGIRVKKIIEHDGINSENDAIKLYEYKDNDSGITSYGILYTEPVNDYIFEPGVEGAAGSSSSYLFYARLSTPIHPFGGEGRRFVGYEKVRVLYGENGEGGTEEHIFTTDPGFSQHMNDTYFSGWSHGVFMAQPDISYRLGGNKETLYKSNVNTLQVRSYDYSFNDEFMLNEPDYIDQNVNPEVYRQFPAMAYYKFDSQTFKYRYYHMFAPWTHQTALTTDTYEGTANPVSVSTTYEFNDSSHKLLTKENRTNSDGTQRIVEYEYAHETDNDGRGENYTPMKDKNMLTQPYSVTIRDNEGVVIEKRWTLWRHDTDLNRWLRDSEWIWRGGNPDIPVFEANN